MASHTVTQQEGDAQRTCRPGLSSGVYAQDAAAGTWPAACLSHSCSGLLRPLPVGNCSSIDAQPFAHKVRAASTAPAAFLGCDAQACIPAGMTLEFAYELAHRLHATLTEPHARDQTA